jgi:glycosyltransferase involved in cell wall biosynthesis
MRILHVIRTLDPAWGGPVEGARNLTSQALERDYKIEIVCFDSPGSKWISSWQPTIHALGYQKHIYAFNPNLDAWLSANLSRFDAVVVHGIWMYFSYSVWKSTRKTNLPYFLFIHGALDPWFKRTYRLKHVKKMIYWRLFEHRVLRDAAAVLFTSEEEMLLAKDAFHPYQCRPAVIGYGIEKPKTTPAFNKESIIRNLLVNTAVTDKSRFILFLARIHAKKGIDILLRAVSNSRSRLLDIPTIVIAGSGGDAELASLKRLARSLNLDNDVVWVGPLYDKAKYDVMRAAEAYVLPSHQENFGISVVESLACGTPVLISNKVNIWREIEAASAGLVEEDTVDGTFRLLQNWGSLSRETKHSMQQNAQKCFDSNFDIRVSSTRYFDVLGGRKWEVATTS